ncbi:MAG: hypothetical protein JSU88_10835 [Nitrospinaceae bacterium]|nr:MAG: hypothetical protein JSU88_10835 [Nitrospinaceae bacterium]
MNQDRLYTLLVRTFVYVFAINAFSYIFADVDLWGHIKFGSDLLTSKSLPLVDTYSYTAGDYPWINHNWLAEPLFALIYSWAGSSGLLIFKLLVGLAIIHILSTLYFAKSGNRLAYALHFLLIAPVLVTGFATRPQILTYLFTTLLVLILQKYFDGNSKAIFWTPLLMAIWVNIHGGIVAGILIFGTVVVVEFFRRLLTGGDSIKPLLLVLFASCLALLINPYGYKLWLFFWETIPKDRPIGEWGPVPLWNTSFLSLKILVILFFITLFLPGKKRPWELTIIILGIFYGFRHERHSVITAILMTPYLPLRLADLFESDAFKRWVPKVSARTHTAVLWVLAGGILFQAHSHFYKYKEADFQIQVNPAVYPIYATRFLDTNRIDGNILILFDWGEYILMKRPASKVSIDGRLWTAYPDKVFRDNMLFAEGAEGWEEVLERYPHDIILMNHRNSGLENAAGWVKIYDDPLARIFIKKTDPPSPVLEKFNRRELIYPKDPVSWTFP